MASIIVGQHVITEIFKMLKVRRLVAKSALFKNGNTGIVPVWPLDLFEDSQHVQCRDVPACQVFGDIGR